MLWTKSIHQFYKKLIHLPQNLNHANEWRINIKLRLGNKKEWVYIKARYIVWWDWLEIKMSQ